MRNQKGITLVALVITIIVLLILAGVSISLVVGQNGVLTRATNAVTAQKAAEVKEAIALAVNACDAHWGSKWATNSAYTRAEAYAEFFAGELGNQGYTYSGTLTAGSSEQTITITKGTETYTVKLTLTENGKLDFATTDAVVITNS